MNVFQNYCDHYYYYKKKYQADKYIADMLIQVFHNISLPLTTDCRHLMCKFDWRELQSPPSSDDHREI